VFGMVAIPQGVSVEINGLEVTVKGPKGTVTKKFSPVISLEKNNSEIIVKGSSKEKAYIGTVNSILSSMIKGVTEGYSKSMKVLYAHFPVTLEVKGSIVYIKNFLGEKNPRKAKIVGPTKVDAKGQNVVVSGPDKEGVGQTIANLRAALKIREKDCRVFQDGIYEVIE